MPRLSKGLFPVGLPVKILKAILSYCYSPLNNQNTFVS